RPRWTTVSMSPSWGPGMTSAGQGAVRMSDAVLGPQPPGWCHNDAPVVIAPPAAGSTGTGCVLARGAVSSGGVTGSHPRVHRASTTHPVPCTPVADRGDWRLLDRAARRGGGSRLSL